MKYTDIKRLAQNILDDHLISQRARMLADGYVRLRKVADSMAQAIEVEKKRTGKLSADLHQALVEWYKLK